MTRPKSPLPFAAWQPDQSVIGGAAAEAKGVIALGGKYMPDKSFIALSGGAIESTALGGAGFYEDGTNVRIFVGDAGALYEITMNLVPVEPDEVLLDDDSEDVLLDDDDNSELIAV